MRSTRVLFALTAANLVLLAGLAVQSLSRPARAQEAGQGAADVPAVIRARALEIVDDQGRVRALLAVMPPATVDGKDYPETVLLRLIDPQAGPVVKLTAAENGSALGLSDSGEGGVQLFGRDEGSVVRVVSKKGEKRELVP
jgi:hypothetical protein